MDNKKENIVSSFIKKIDIFSVGVGFNIEQEEQFGTILGGLVFILYLAACAYFILVNFFDFVSRESFNQNIIETQLDYAPCINLINKKIGFAIGLTVDGSPILKDNDNLLDLITFKMTHVYKANGTKTKAPVNYTKCTKEHFGNAINESFDLNKLGDYFCIDPLKNNINGSLSVQGIYTEAVFQYIEISVTVTKEGLLQDAYLDDYFLTHEVKLQMYYIDSSISVDNFSTPEKIYLNSKFLKISFPFLLKANADFSNNTFDNDANILFTSSSIFSFYTLESFDQSYEYRGFSRFTDKKSDYDLLAKIYIRSSQSTITYKRTYQKFTEYLADSTSIVSQVLIILVMVFGAYDQFKAKEYIIDNMLKYKMKFINQNPKGFVLMKDLFDKIPKDKEYYVTLTNEDKATLNDTQKNYLCLSRNNSSAENDKDKKTVSSGSSITTLRKNAMRKRSQRMHTYHNNIVSSESLKKIITIREEENQNENLITNTGEDGSNYYNSNFKIDNSIPLYMNYLSEKVQNRYKTKISKIKQKNEGNNDTLVYSCCDLFKSLFAKIGCCKKDKHFQNKENLFSKGLERYLYNVDIFTYFTKMREIDILKHILLTANQRAMLDFLSKPSISLIIKDSESPLTKSLNIFDNTLSNIENFYNSFVKCSDEYLKKRTESHDKLLRLTAYELYQLIQEEKVDEDV